MRRVELAHALLLGSFCIKKAVSLARAAVERANTLLRMVFVQINRLLHEEWVLVQVLLVLLSLMGGHDVAGFFCSEGAECVVLRVAKHSYDRTRADRPVICWVRECSPRIRSIGLPDCVVVLG